MSQEYIEITEKTVSEAITAACQKLAVPSERIEYEVIDPGKTGFLGIGARPAKIRARVKQGMEDSAEFDTSAIISDVLKGKDDKKKAPDQRPKEKRKEERKDNKKKESNKNSEKTAAKKTLVKEEAAETASPAVKEETASEEKRSSAEAAAGKAEKTETSESGFSGKKGTGRKDFSEKSYEKGSKGRGRRRQRRNDRDEYSAASRDHEQERSTAAESHSAPKKKSAVPVLTDEQVVEIKQRAETFLTDVFQAMDLDANVSSSYDRETGMLTIDMKGENMGVLIGKRGQTLDSLQYLVSLVVNKGIDGYIHVKADTENYRERRKKTLENLAKNIASKVKRNRTSVALEPMNPYERRIIHSALQGDRYVTTYSEGEEPYRKVIVTMKEDR